MAGAIAAPQEPDGALILHSEPGREDLFYLGWCHGPAGTVRFLRTLARVTRDEAWLRAGEELVSGLHASGIPGARPAGFWNNVGACCGNAGVVDFLLALHELDGRERDRELAVTLLADLLARSTADENGRRWTHAEHRVRPDELSTQTGFMQRAAGIGMGLLRAWAYETGRTPSIVLPDEPWPGLVRRDGR